MCSLNVDIPSSMTVRWILDSSFFMITPLNEVTQTGNTATLLIVNPQPSDAGDYECFFMGLDERRVIVLGNWLVILLIQYSYYCLWIAIKSAC